MSIPDFNDFKSIGCPKCGAQHKYFKSDNSLVACYGCHSDFYPSESRLYTHNRKEKTFGPEIEPETKKPKAPGIINKLLKLIKG